MFMLKVVILPYNLRLSITAVPKQDGCQMNNGHLYFDEFLLECKNTQLLTKHKTMASASDYKRFKHTGVYYMNTEFSDHICHILFSLDLLTKICKIVIQQVKCYTIPHSHAYSKH